MREKQKLVPKLRFPEFREAGEWQSGQLVGALSSISNGLTLEQGSDAIGYKVTRIETISAGTIDLEKVGLVKTSQNISAYKLQIGDILLSNINSVAHIGKSVFVDRDYDLYHGMNLLRLGVNRSKHDPQFIFYLINTDGIRASLRERANKAVNQASINQTELGKTEVAFPLVPEQQKIAVCLAFLDELITLEAQKLDTLKTHKKGLMQQLFPAEGETLPKLRFPEFRDAGEWKKRNISNLLVRSINPLSVEIEETYREIGIRSHGKGIFHKEPVLGKALGDKRVFRVEENAFVLNIVFAWEQAVAVTTVAERGMIASHRFPMYKPDERKSDVDFIKYFFLTNKGKELLGIASPGGAGRNKTLGQKEFEKLEFLSPGKVEEQTAIARCLSSVDDLITTQAQKLAALKIHKKGLMQQLFPNTATTPPLRGTPPEEGNRAKNSPPVEGWQAKPDGVVK